MCFDTPLLIKTNNNGGEKNKYWDSRALILMEEGIGNNTSETAD